MDTFYFIIMEEIWSNHSHKLKNALKYELFKSIPLRRSEKAFKFLKNKYYFLFYLLYKDYNFVQYILYFCTVHNGTTGYNSSGKYYISEIFDKRTIDKFIIHYP